MTRPGASLTVEAEDYLKAIYELSRANAREPADAPRTVAQERGASAAERVAPVGTTALAAHLGIAAASVSGMLGRLARLGLVRTERYRGTRLTTRGRAIALQLIRRHRIIETFLVTRLGYAWEDVHDEAERLEHAASADLVERMARDIGNPTQDPHGAPIPTAAGDVDERRFATLASLETGASARVQGMSDRNADLLRYLADRGIKPGARVTVEAREPFDGPMVLSVGRSRETVSPTAAANVWVAGDATSRPGAGRGGGTRRTARRKGA